MSVSLDTIINHLHRWSGVLVFLLLWEIGPRLEWIDPYFMPPFSQVLVGIGTLFRDGYLGIHLLVSCWRALAGLLVAVLCALPLGFLLGRRFPSAAEAIDPVLRVLSQVNPFTLLPVFVLFFGIGETAKVAVVGWVSVWPVLFHTVTASRQVDPIQIKTAAAMGISPAHMIIKVIIPAALPTIFVGIRIGTSITFYILVAAEMLGASAGLGWLVHNSAMNYQIPRIYAGATFIIILGFLLNRALLYFEHHLFIWQEKVAFLHAASKVAPSGWRPNRFAAAAFTLTLLVFLLFGGIEVQKINRQASAVTPEGEGHDRHFGSAVDSGN